MTVVAIIGILVAIALPQYQNYQVRSRIGDALSLVGSAKTAVGVYYSEENDWPFNNAEAGLSDSESISSVHVREIKIQSDPLCGIIRIRLRDISELGAIKVMVPSEAIRTHNPNFSPFVLETEGPLPVAKLTNGSKVNPIAKPAPARVDVFRKVLRFKVCFLISAFLFQYQFSRTTDSPPYPDISSAATQICHFLFNLFFA